ncbi:transcriptional regulator GlcC [Nitrincola iocasae]|uniref:Transcriptional regulator GlcC n=1 Tax=Nitrincola iocasae TaxID=2614693 RepID=A0A5J6LB34_9GAMM|nr:transcriptional regulator GlcC [Nitrincola iocasae]QEW05745.1 transcriptional regulator GlcC [Nitrincola iocasae]
MVEEMRQIADVVADRIETLILDGVLKPGQRLPSERQLSEKLGFSRSALREGLKLLRARGIILTEHGRGSYVAKMMPEPSTPLMHLFSEHPRTLYDLLEVRALLEGESARLAAMRGTDADFIMIRRRYEEMVALTQSDEPVELREHARVDHAFHLAVCEASHNPVLVHTLQSLTDLLISSVFASLNNLYHRPVQKRQIDRQHARLFHAVVDRLPEQARRAAVEHIQGIRDELQDIEVEEQRLLRASMRLNGW